MEHINTMKAAAASAVAVLTSLWGWFGWVVVLYAVCMVGDYVSGSAAALRNGKWTSKAARDGIWHKAGSVLVVMVAGGADLLIGTILEHIPGLALPFEYTVLFCPVVVVWYILTEMGSIIENAVALGAPCPAWLGTAVDKMLDSVDDTMGGRDDEN